jgi:hypothetical protein
MGNNGHSAIQDNEHDISLCIEHMIRGVSAAPGPVQRHPIYSVIMVLATL